MKTTNKPNLRISNMILTGRMPFRHKLRLNEIKRLINHSVNGWKWMIVNEEISPIISTDVPKEAGLNVHGKKKKSYVSIWTTGAINIIGVTSRREAEEIYLKVMRDIKKNCRRVLVE